MDDNAVPEWNEKVKGIVDEFKNQHPSVDILYIVNSTNQGSAKTRNIGIEASSGEYITFLDDDDIYFPSKVENQVAFMKQGEYDYSITDLRLCDESDKLVEMRKRSYIKKTDSAELLKYHLKYQ